MSVSLKYTASGVDYIQAITPLSLKGFDAFDELESFPAIQNTLLDGTKTVQSSGIRRKFTLDMGVVTDSGLLTYLVNFCMGGFLPTLQYISNDGGSTWVQVVLEDASKFSSTWEGGIQFAKHIVLRLDEVSLRTTWS
jgi:hypothetical protein